MMANYEIVEFIAIMQRLVDKFTISFYERLYKYGRF